MRALKLLAVLLVLLGVLGFLKWHQVARVQALHNATPTSGIAVVHFYARW